MGKVIAVIAVVLATSLVPSPFPIAEDDPGWNCHTMGNHICGTEQTL